MAHARHRRVAPAADRPAGGTAVPAAVGRPRRPRLTRQEKGERSREAICQAAAEIIGEHGYAEASIARIMERAGLASGTFYGYFDSRQDLFDVLLPMKGAEVLDVLHDRTSGVSGIIELECRGFLGFFEYAQQHPWFFRLLHEAHVAAPEGHRRHVSNILDYYRKLLKRCHDAGDMPGYDASELDTLAFLLMSARDYVYSQQVMRSDDPAATIRKAVDTYAKFVAHGLCGAADVATARDPAAKVSTAKPKPRSRKTA